MLEPSKILKSLPPLQPFNRWEPLKTGTHPSLLKLHPLPTLLLTWGSSPPVGTPLPAGTPAPTHTYQHHRHHPPLWRTAASTPLLSLLLRLLHLPSPVAG
jgi:hypothetical protein